MLYPEKTAVMVRKYSIMAGYSVHMIFSIVFTNQLMKFGHFFFI